MSWKDYFYFQKQDKIATIILLALIVIAGSIYILTSGSKTTDPAIEVNVNNEFINRQADTIHSSYLQYRKTPDSKEINNYPRQPKLQIGQTIELNSADTTLLKMIPGIGSSFANRIVKYRNLLGGYYIKTQLKEVYNLDMDLYQKISPYITTVPKTNRINVNTTDFKELLRHPYINYQQVKAITDIRTRKGKIESISRLELLEEFTEEDIKRLTPYLSFD